jgi:modulator of FtsH protease HflC
MTLWKQIRKGIAVTLVAAAAYGSFFVVDQKEHAVVTRFGNPKRVVINPAMNDAEAKQRAEQTAELYSKEGIGASFGPGLYLKFPFIDSVKRIDNRVLRWDGYPEQFPTRDKKYLWVDTTVRVAIEDPLKFYRNVETEEQMHGKLDDVIDSIARNVISSHNLIEIVRSSNRPMQVTEKELEESVQVGDISEGRKKLMDEICAESQKTCEQYGLRVLNEGYLIKGLTYVDEVRSKVEERMISERSRLAEKYLSEGRGEAQKIHGQRELKKKEIISAAYRESQIIRGEAEAAAIKTYGDAYGTDPELYKLLGTLEVYGKLGPHTSMVLGTDNDLFRYLKGPPVFKQKIPTTQPAEK